MTVGQLRGVGERRRALAAGGRAGIMTVLVLAVALVACGGRTAPCDVRPGCDWSLSPGGATIIPAEDLAAEGRVLATLDIPAGARQGPGSWFRLDLPVEIALDPGRVAGAAGQAEPAYVVAAVDGAAAFQLKLEALPGGDCGAWTVAWSTVGLVHGRQEGRAPCDGSIRIAFANFLQDRSVHAGPVDVTVAVQGDTHGLVRSVTVEPRARVAVTPDGPAGVDIDVLVERARPGSPSWARLTATVTEDGTPAAAPSLAAFLLGQGAHPEPLDVERAGDEFVVEVAWPEGDEPRLLLVADTGRGSSTRVVRPAGPGSAPRMVAVAAPALLGVAAALAALCAMTGRPRRRPRGIRVA